ncbi:MAG: SRPBCC family protein [Luteimonas sp.]
MSDSVHDLSIERRMAAPPAAVWRAWTEHLTEWFAPAPWKTVKAELDLRPGGRFHAVMEGPDGERADGGAGVLLEVVPERRIVFTDALGPDWMPRKPFMVAIIELTPDGDGTLYRATVRHWDAESKKRHEEMGFHPGWSQVAEQLEAVAVRLR